MFTLKSSCTNIPCSMTLKVYGSRRKPRAAELKLPSSTSARPVPPAVGHGIVHEAGAEGDRAARIGVREGRRPAIDEAIAELQLMTAAQPHERVFDLVVKLLRIDRQERRSTGYPGEVRDVDVGQPRRDVVDVDAVDAERLRRLMAVVGLERRRLRLRVADAQLVDQIRLDHLRVVECRAVGRQARVLDAGNERPEIEPGRRLGWRRQTAVRLALRSVELELAVVEPHEERVVVRDLVIDSSRKRVVGDLAIRRRDVVVEVA